MVFSPRTRSSRVGPCWQRGGSGVLPSRGGLLERPTTSTEESPGVYGPGVLVCGTFPLSPPFFPKQQKEAHPDPTNRDPSLPTPTHPHPHPHTHTQPHPPHPTDNHTTMRLLVSSLTLLLCVGLSLPLPTFLRGCTFPPRRAICSTRFHSTFPMANFVAKSPRPRSIGGFVSLAPLSLHSQLPLRAPPPQKKNKRQSMGSGGHELPHQ